MSLNEYIFTCETLVNYKNKAHSACFSRKMCNFAAELKYVANKEKLVDIQWDNTF